MALDERSRHQLYIRLEDILGAEAASTLMEHLPPVGWADVATKRDLDALWAATKQDLSALREVMDARFEAVDSRFDALEGRLLAEIRAMGSQTLRANLALIVAVVSLVFAASRIH